MKKFLVRVLFCILICGSCDLLKATNLDGTSSIQYQSKNYVFRDGDLARGIICFADGFTVIPGANHGSNLLMDSNISISGCIDLRGTSTMTLLHDTWLDNGVTFSDSGRLYSYGSALIMMVI